MTENAAPAPAPAPTVLVVEDEALVAMLVTDALADAGYGSIWSPDGHPASTTENGADATAAVVDLRLADGRDGRDVVRRLRELRPALPVVVVTGFDPEAPQADLRGLGGPTLRLHKPFDSEDVVGGMSAVLDAPASPPAPRRRRSDRLEVPA